jgi:hypothetical protein
MKAPTKPVSPGREGRMVRSHDAARSDPLPNFLVIGAMKAGTTSLFRYLEPHPEVFMPRLKELDFFIAEGNWGRGIGWYRHQFRQAGQRAVAIGEASPTYSKYPQFDGVPERIAGAVPAIRLIYVVRDPVERIRSHYSHRVLVGSESNPIEVAVSEDPSYLDCSRYAMQIGRYMDWFDREQLLIVRSEDLRSRRTETLSGVHRFLGVDPDVVPPTIDEEFFVTRERESYPAFVWWTRRGLKHLVPERHRWRIRRTINQALTVPTWMRHNIDQGAIENAPASSEPPIGNGEPIPPMSRALRARLADELREDVVALHRYMPEGFDGWGIAA